MYKTGLAAVCAHLLLDDRISSGSVLDTPISLLLVICLLVLLFAVSVVGCLLGYSSCLVVWIPLFLDPSDGAFGRFDLAALCGCRTLNFCLFVCLLGVAGLNEGCLLTKFIKGGFQHPNSAKHPFQGYLVNSSACKETIVQQILEVNAIWCQCLLCSCSFG